MPINHSKGVTKPAREVGMRPLQLLLAQQQGAKLPLRSAFTLHLLRGIYASVRSHLLQLLLCLRGAS